MCVQKSVFNAPPVITFNLLGKFLRPRGQVIRGCAASGPRKTNKSHGAIGPAKTTSWSKPLGGQCRRHICPPLICPQVLLPGKSRDTPSHSHQSHLGLSRRRRKVRKWRDKGSNQITTWRHLHQEVWSATLLPVPDLQVSVLTNCFFKVHRGRIRFVDKSRCWWW